MNCNLPLSTIIALSLAHQASAINIVLDYGPDPNAFFGGDAAARAAVDQAASDLSDVLTNNLAPVTQDTFNGQSDNGNVSIDVNMDFVYNDPYTGVDQTVSDISTGFPADSYVIFVGTRILGDNTLGQGGPGRLGFGSNPSASFASGATMSDWAEAGDAVSAAATAQISRGSGPTFGSRTASFGNGDQISVTLGLATGNLWFDIDTDNDNMADTATTLDSFWHYDHTAAVAAGQSDLYTVALHEIIHALGVGGSDQWNAQIAGTDWTGAEVIAENGGDGSDLIDPLGAHIALGVMSPTIADGTLQEVVQSPSLAPGTRKTLTHLDVAFLRDLNFTSIDLVPEPSSALLLLAGFGFLGRRRR